MPSARDNSPSPKSAPITALLDAWNNGRPEARNALAEEVYAELRQLAAQHLARERQQALQTTELVHEAWLRLEREGLHFPSRRHFFAFAALQMQRLLLDLARSRLRGDQGEPVSATLAVNLADANEQPADIAGFANALEQLTRFDERKSQVFALTELTGFSIAETAEILSISPATVQRDLRFSKVWLATRLEAV